MLTLLHFSGEQVHHAESRITLANVGAYRFVEKGNEGSNPGLSPPRSLKCREIRVDCSENCQEMGAILLSNRTGESVTCNSAGALSRVFLWWADE
jgi:hypothetical protein